MTRIIAGAAGGVSLASVPGSSTRPTTDRTKEALFSWLDSRGWLDETRVLDLFAGSGALGCESASRGATEVLLVEKHRKAAATAKKNATAVNQRLGHQIVQVQDGTVETALQNSEPAGWDLILADPPYDYDGKPMAQTLELVTAALADDGLLVLERSSRSAVPSWPEPLELIEDRSYGESRLFFLRPEAVSV